MNLLIELSNGDLEEVEVEDTELLYDDFWGNTEAMGEARDILLDMQKELSELSGSVHAKCDLYDERFRHLYEHVIPDLTRSIQGLTKAVAAVASDDQVQNLQLKWISRVAAFMAGSAVTAMVAHFLT